jgi:hypothetical protein
MAGGSARPRCPRPRCQPRRQEVAREFDLLWTAWVAIITPSGPPTGYTPHARGRSSAARRLLEPRRGLS